MAELANRRDESVPRIVARRHWKRYAAGMATEVMYVLALAAVALAVAVAATVMYR